MVNAQPGKLNLPGMAGNGDIFHHPVVKRPVVLKLQRAQGVGDSLQSILNGVGKVIHGVDAPFVTLTVMVHMPDAVDNGVAHIEVAGGKVNFGPEGITVILKFAGTHPGEQVQAFLYGPVPPGGLGRGIYIAPVFLELLGGQLADVGQALLDQLNSVFVVLFKVVGTVVEPITPVKTQPVNILLDGFDKLHILFGRIGVIHPQIAHSAVFLGSSEIDDQSLAVTDVQIAIWLRRKPGMDRLPGILPAGGNVLINKRVDEILALCNFSHR